jgi:hypothetical protein
MGWCVMTASWFHVVCSRCREDLGYTDSLMAATVANDLHRMFAHGEFPVVAK